MTFYDFLKDIREELEEKIVDFFEERIQGKFSDSDCKHCWSKPLKIAAFLREKTTANSSMFPFSKL